MSSGSRQPQISILDARLAEIDRRLHTIQSDLESEPAVAPAPEPRGSTTWRPAQHRRRPAPARPPRPAVAETGDAEVASTETIARLEELSQAQASILASLRELLGVFERLAIPAATSTAPSGSAPGPVGLSAGPFTSTRALRAFQRSLESLPGVRSVEVRGFEGGDRAILDVHLA